MFLTQEIYILDLIGTFAFAVFGSYLAMQKKFDIFGVFVCAFLTAVGGGTIREIIVGNIPFYFSDLNYIYVIIVATLFSMYFFKKFDKVKLFALVLDAIGLVTFAFIGATKAANLGLGTFAIIFFATLTAVGGGILRDIILNKIPDVMHSDIYASIAIVFGLVYSLCINCMQDIYFVNILLLIFFIFRLFVIYYRMELWKPNCN